MYRIEFDDFGTLRDCTTDNYFTAATLFDNLQRLKYLHVYMYRTNPEEELMQVYHNA